MILRLTTAHESVFNTPVWPFFLLNKPVKLFCKFLALKNYVILANAIIDVNCENQLSWRFF